MRVSINFSALSDLEGKKEIIESLQQNAFAAYIDSWIKALKADKKAIFRASSQAREATQFLLDALASELPEDKLAA